MFPRQLCSCPCSIWIQIDSRELYGDPSSPSPVSNLPQQAATAASHVHNMHWLNASARFAVQPCERRTVAHQPAVDLFQAAQATEEFLIAACAVHQLRKLTRGYPLAEIHRGVIRHESAWSPLSVQAQTTLRTRVA